MIDMLPDDLDAERALLGAILVDPDAFNRVSASVDVDDFAAEKHRRIFTAMSEVYRAGSVIDRVTLAGRLMDSQRLESIGGLTYLSNLDTAIGAIFGTDDYCRRVKSKSVLRRAIVAMTASIAEMQQYGESQEVLERAERTIRDLNAETTRDRRLKTAGEIITADGGLDRFLQHTAAAVVTPWPTLNTILGGGLRKQELVVLGARPSVGKTAAALQFAECAAVHGITSAVYSLEMGAKPLIQRMACGRARIDSNALRLGHLNHEHRVRLRVAIAEIAEMPIYFDDTAACTVSAIHASLRRLTAHRKVGFVVIDYLQLIESPGKYENRTQAVSAVSRGLKLAAMDFEIPFLVLSQLKRMGDNEDREPGLSDLRESGSIEQDADIVMFLHSKKQEYGSVRDTKLIVSKQRNGPIGYIPMNFFRSSTRLEEQIDEHYSASA